MDAGKPTQEQIGIAHDLYHKIDNLSKARKIEMPYMKDHLNSILKGDPKPGFGRTDVSEATEDADTDALALGVGAAIAGVAATKALKRKAKERADKKDKERIKKYQKIIRDPNSTPDQKEKAKEKMDRAEKRMNKRNESIDARYSNFREKLKALGYKKESKETLSEKEIKGLRKKSEKTGIPYGILKQVYNRGMAAWKTGHRPGTTPQQWAFARVNSFATKSKGTWGGADKDLAAKARKAKK